MMDESDRAGNVTGGHSCPPPETPQELWECVTCKAQFMKPMSREIPAVLAP